MRLQAFSARPEQQFSRSHFLSPMAMAVLSCLWSVRASRMRAVRWVGIGAFLKGAWDVMRKRLRRVQTRL